VVTSHEIVPLDKSERERAAVLLGRAFYDSPQWTGLMPDDEIRRERLPMMFAGAAKMTSAAGGSPQRTDSFGGVALWLPPGRDIGFLAMVRSGLTSARWALTPPVQNLRRLTRVMLQFDRKKKELVKEPHWYLMALGVDPDHQGEGHGSALVRWGVAQAERDNAMVYLETETEENLDFYKGLGFEVLDEMVLNDIDIAFSLLVRRPGS
jgi:GNAT superfamily N-acetyltransferase